MLAFIKKKQLGTRFIYLLELLFTSQAVLFVSPAQALDTNRDCGLYGVYNGKGRVVYDRTPVVIDLTSTIFDPPVTRDIQEQRCKKALTEAVEQQAKLDIDDCPSQSQPLIGLITSEGITTEVVRARTVYSTGIVTVTEYRTMPVLICEPSGPNRCRNVYRPIPVPQQVEKRVSSCRLSF
jgi:hypothetical protein